jgi:hypothetical protein
VGEWAARAANKLRRRILKNTLLDWIGVSFADKALLSEMLNSRSQSKLPITMPACKMTWIRRHAFAAAASSSNHGQIRATPADGVNFIPYMKLLGWSKNIFIPKTQLAPAVSLFPFPTHGSHNAPSSSPPLPQILHPWRCGDRRGNRVGPTYRGWRRDSLYKGDGEGVLVHGEKREWDRETARGVF